MHVYKVDMIPQAILKVVVSIWLNEAPTLARAEKNVVVIANPASPSSARFVPGESLRLVCFQKHPQNSTHTVAHQKVNQATRWLRLG
ncbi:Protein often near L-alanine-DL-glutamate epimerase (cell wall recycling) [Anopheles sinensis]|uniref:Protein often near L-alanine-DL-glutamate epimerase (Cell wall recycling) n=1 Tax=Anopheles sinensis TaxID=74873 RepID=A0A084VCX3_ANOSI|nr:Protein often near L-alanine-DL-glutamate epimerase (cell wall recycling) [Anopheles sinensis]